MHFSVFFSSSSFLLFFYPQTSISEDSHLISRKNNLYTNVFIGLSQAFGHYKYKTTQYKFMGPIKSCSIKFQAIFLKINLYYAHKSKFFNWLTFYLIVVLFYWFHLQTLGNWTDTIILKIKRSSGAMGLYLAK